MQPRILKLPENRVRRNYRGGAGIDRFKGRSPAVDTEQPEEWVASLTAARNPGLTPTEHEGISPVQLPSGATVLLTDLIAAHPQHYLGRPSLPVGRNPTNFLFKILDAAMRLHVQAHPTRAFARSRLQAPFGKLETYVILAVRPDMAGYIRLGFQKDISLSTWKRIVFEQDIDSMDDCFEKIPVAPGEVWLVPGGLPHAIGEGVTVLEIMEPSDLVVRCEFEREGIVVPPEARYMGQNPELAMDIFDMTARSPAVIRQNYCITPRALIENDTLLLNQLIGPEETDCFEVLRAVARRDTPLQLKHSFTGGVVVAGQGTIASGDDTITVEKGGTFLLAAAAGEVHLSPGPDAPLELVLVQDCPDALVQT
jgi:mannose-6-phosphate isomerase